MRPPYTSIALTSLLSSLAMLAACDVGSVADRDLDLADASASDVAADDPSGAADAAPGTQLACDDPVADTASGEHNAGQPCLDCHSAGGDEDAPEFRLGGTIYTGLAGGDPVVGATVRITDADGVEHEAVSARNGNFWIRTAIAFPVQAMTSSCPDAMAMAAPIDAAGGNCNSGGCHDADYRIHLP